MEADMINLKVGSKKKHEISKYLYMQFMEPLSVTDSSVDAAWDYMDECWYPSVVEATRDLAPSMIRWGGCFASFCHWREGVGPREQRVPMKNYAWGGLYSNQVGTNEVLDFCRQVNAEPLLVANMESEGLPYWQRPKNDTVRMGTAQEAAEWVDYCNNPDNALRISHGVKKPYGVKYWQIGNETSYRTLSYNGHSERGFTLEGCYEATTRFAKAMRQVDDSIKIIGWGDRVNNYGGEDHHQNWCKRMSQVEGIDMLAFHHHFGSGLDNSPLRGTQYRDDVEETWRHLMNAYKSVGQDIERMRADCGNKRLAMTEGHFALPGRNRNEVLSSWGAGVAYARCLNVIMRNSDILDIATMADFFGNVWQVNALMIPTPIRTGRPYLQPVGQVMRMFSRYQGKYMLDLEYNGAIDAVASATDNEVYLHIANTDMKYSQELLLDLGGAKIKSGEMCYIATAPEVEITPDNDRVFEPVTVKLEGDKVTIPPAAVAAIKLVI